MSTIEAEEKPTLEENMKLPDSLIEKLCTTNITDVEKRDLNLIQESLKGLECPFNWKFHELDVSITNSSIISSIREEIIDQINTTEDGITNFDCFKWTRFTLELCLSFLLTNEGEYEEARHIVSQCAEKLQKLAAVECKDPLFYRIEKALLHLTYSSLLYTCVKSNIKDREEATRIKNKIPCILGNGSDIEKAGVYGMKAYMLKQCYGPEVNHLFLESAEMAKDLDPEMAEWWSLIGHAEGNMRKALCYLETMKDKEINAFENAVKLQPSPWYMVLLAETYRICGSRLYRKSKTDKHFETHNIDSMYEKAHDLYMKIWEMEGLNLYVLCRLADGFMILPRQYKNTCVAEKVVLKCLELAPNNANVHQIAGNLYNSYLKNMSKAVYHLELSENIGQFYAALDLLKIKTKIDPCYDAYEDLIKYLNKYKKFYHQVHFYCQLGSYFLFKKRNLIKAIEQYTTVIIKDRLSLLKATYVPFNSVDEPVDVLKIVTDEARLALQSSSSLSEEDKITLKKFIDTVSKLSPDTIINEPEPNQVENLVEKSYLHMNKAHRTYYQKVQEYGHKQSQSERSDQRESRNFRDNSRYRGGNSSRYDINPNEKNWRKEMRND